MPATTVAALAGHFGRDVDRAIAKVTAIIEDVRRDDVNLLVLPDACLGGYIGDLRSPDLAHLPPALDPDGPEIAAIVTAAGSMTVCLGYAEAAHGLVYNAAVCVSGDGILGTHRKV